MEHIQQLLNYILHIDGYLFSFVSTYGTWTYLVLFLIIFCETGLIIIPFLPGDSLLFASGSLAAQADASLDIIFLMVLLTLASVFGNQVNYLIGKRIGPQIFNKEGSLLLNKKYLGQTHAFYERHGGKTIILARFMPIIRTFAPFIAGIGLMRHSQFLAYNIASAVLWIGSLLCLGYFVGGLPFVKNNFTLVIYAIIAISLLPPVFSFAYHKLTGVSASSS
ncbi:DedA family protein [Legionella jordanis]|uniref:DedA family protein n=1 Tax=Legionella jordanis TaxID=456 RepID=A0A0W0V8R8_9GAMM|nr:DedA family protein [Legionella jordanis]KTD16472.1 DedA family protein [Legionella jordanis]RMX03978.1 DedA family protein [Legionella jordanis]RMX21952.1 DedA family protein [Legionella jordanis]VEH12068.1 DedA family protein [Legionella jordanis]HAT8712631.1 DedA family protein [Legionella jordanis]